MWLVVVWGQIPTLFHFGCFWEKYKHTCEEIDCQNIVFSIFDLEEHSHKIVSRYKKFGEKMPRFWQMIFFL